MVIFILTRESPLPKTIKYDVPTWEDIYEFLIELAERIGQSGFKPDIIVGVARGGWPPARILSDFLQNPNLANIKAEFYVDIYKTTEEPRITQPISASVKGKNVLVADDVADSGKSLELIRKHLLEEGASNVRICTIYYKPWSIVIPDYYAKKTDAWVVFPWERKEASAKIGQKLKNEGKSLKEIENTLVKIGIKRQHVRHFIKDIFRERK